MHVQPVMTPLWTIEERHRQTGETRKIISLCSLALTFQSQKLGCYGKVIISLNIINVIAVGIINVNLAVDF